MSARRFETPARVRIEQSDEAMCAHVEIDVTVGPGDRVRLHGDPIHIGFGEQVTLVRTATVDRASPLRRAWTRLAGHLMLTELYEVSFKARRLP